MGQESTHISPLAKKALPPQHAGGGYALPFYDPEIPQGGDYAVWELDFQAVVRCLADLRLQGVRDLGEYLQRRPDQLDQLLKMIRIVSVSSGSGRGFGKSRLGRLSWARIVHSMAHEARANLILALDMDREPARQHLRVRPDAGAPVDAALSVIFATSKRSPAIAYLTEVKAQVFSEPVEAVEMQKQIMGELKKLSKSISRTSNDETTVTLILKAALKISGADYCLFLRPGPPARRGRLNIAAVVRAGPKRQLPDGPDLRQLEFGAAFFNVSAPRPFRMPGNASSYGLPTVFNGQLAAGSYLAVPFACEHGTQTCSILLARKAGEAYPAEVVNALSIMSALATLSLDKAFLARRSREEQERHRQDFRAAQQLAAIVESSGDAIFTKDLDGTITSWNAGARRLFGYEANEAVGRPVAMLIPPERRDEETEILTRIRAGKRVEHYETERLHKNGNRINISLTVSPVRDLDGQIVGASKVARDITDTVRAKNLQRLLLQEMDHRIKNLFALCSSIVSLCGHKASSPRDLVQAIRSRFMSLARAHDLVFSSHRPEGGVQGGGTNPAGTVGLLGLVETVLVPFQDQLAEGLPRIRIAGANPEVSGSSLATVALLVHEFATNAAKYGSLGQVDGRVDIQSVIRGDMLHLQWRETGTLVRPPDDIVEGFGSVMTRAAIEKQLSGEIARRWGEGGIEIEMTIAMERLKGG